jgi:hypothetical protein
MADWLLGKHVVHLVTLENWSELCECIVVLSRRLDAFSVSPPQQQLQGTHDVPPGYQVWE